MTAEALPATKLRLLVCQIDIPATTDCASRDRHLQTIHQRVRAALQQSEAVDGVVLPELSSVDYSRASFDALSQLAESLDGPSFHCWAALAREFNCAVVYGFPRFDDSGEYRICSAMVGADGALKGYYDKLHLAQFGASMEQEYFSAGKHLAVFELAGFRLAPIICFDIRPPELCRQLVVEHHADVILHLGAYARDPSFFSWHAFAQTRAVENQVFFLSLNRAGEFFGDSLFVPPWIDEKIRTTAFARHAEEFKVLQLDRAVIEQARRDFAFLAERLGDYQLPLQDFPCH